MADDVKEVIRSHGIRKALLTSNCSHRDQLVLYAGNVSSGIEPVFAYSYHRKDLQKDWDHNEQTRL